MKKYAVDSAPKIICWKNLCFVGIKWVQMVQVGKDVGIHKTSSLFYTTANHFSSEIVSFVGSWKMLAYDWSLFDVGS